MYMPKNFLCGLLLRLTERSGREEEATGQALVRKTSKALVRKTSSELESKAIRGRSGGKQ